MSVSALYRGYCSHNVQALQAAAEMRAAKADLSATLAATPGIEPKTVSRATTYLERFFTDIATDAVDQCESAEDLPVTA